MKNTFKLTEDGIRLLKSKQRKRVIQICFFMLLPFFIAPLFTTELQSETYFVVLIVIAILMLTTLFFMQNVFIDTTIEIFELGIVRKGRNLSTVELKFSEIGKIIERTDGVVIFKRETYKKLKFLSDRGALTNRNDVVFVPIGIDNFEKIVKFIKYKTENK